MKPTEKEIREARELLHKAGYAVENLWSADDVLSRFAGIFTDEALDIMNTVLSTEYIAQYIWESVDDEAESRDYSRTDIAI